jgi:hypothetical protein
MCPVQCVTYVSGRSVEAGFRDSHAVHLQSRFLMSFFR